MATGESLSSAITPKSPIKTILGGRYRLVREIGSGSFGDVYLAVNINTGEEVAVKLESTRSKYSQLIFESKVYGILDGGLGIPNIKWFGKDQGNNILVMDLLGQSLEELLNFCSRQLSLKTVLMLADQMISRLEYVHSKNYVHQDLKPENFLVGTGPLQSRIFLIDYGLSKRYRSTRTLKHISYCEDRSMTGTARYASINAHLGIEMSRRDDMESLGYILLYLLRGTLPWQGIEAATKSQKFEKICERKMSTSLDKLCEGSHPEFETYLRYCRALGFYEKPNYVHLRRIFRTLFMTFGYKYDYIFDWILLQEKETRTV